MSTRAVALNIVNLMNDERLMGFVSLFRDLVSDIPNDETIKAMKEAEEMLQDDNAQRFTAVDELFRELRS